MPSSTTDLTNWAPFQILAGPADVYLAAVSTTFPAVNAAASGSWTFLGQTDGGVVVRHTQNITPITTDQHTGPVKALRTEENCELDFSLVELTLENYALVLNNATVASAAGPPAIKTVKIHQGIHVGLFAMLIRGRSPYGNFGQDYQVPVVYQSAAPEIHFDRADKSVLACTFSALEDLTASAGSEYGQIVAQTA